MNAQTVYVFLISRPCDRGSAWPAVYTSKELAEQAFGRISDVVEVTLPIIETPQ
jgi:hypothetical protein